LKKRWTKLEGLEFLSEKYGFVLKSTEIERGIFELLDKRKLMMMCCPVYSLWTGGLKLDVRLYFIFSESK